MIIGIDDTDSKEGMCTTYLAAVLMEELSSFGTIIDYPLLIRLNPNIKFRTRGNAAIAFELELKNSSNMEKVKNLVTSYVEKMSVLHDENTNPGVVFIEGESEKLKKDISSFSMRAVKDVLEIKEALELFDIHGIDHRGFKNGRGLIGALAATGFLLPGLPDFTYELIAYREENMRGKPREINESSVWKAASVPGTWDTVDEDNKRIVFAPHSPDPILFGIRGNSEEAVRQAFSFIKSEPVERHVVYRTNQNTDMHLIPAAIKDVRDERSYILSGMVRISPLVIEGGHIIFQIMENGNFLECAAFEPTKGFRDIIRQLRPGDEVTVFGSVKNRTLNLEKIKITSLNTLESRNPLCCGKRMKSTGREQGYRCSKCGAVKANREMEIISRSISPGFYEVPPVARRHLSKPLVRYENIS